MFKNIFGYRFNYLNLFIPVVIGICAGIFGIIFLEAIHFFLTYF
ncbi:MAG: hypothetical protein Q9M89_05805 [Persephonella sp.]|nr:hypothetical protein [Persephonella sp.]